MSRGFLLDTNVPSELTRPHPDPRVTQWLEDKDDDLMHVSLMTTGDAACAGFCGSCADRTEASGASELSSAGHSQQ